jgi:hypothetical protein
VVRFELVVQLTESLKLAFLGEKHSDTVLGQVRRVDIAVRISFHGLVGCVCVRDGALASDVNTLPFEEFSESEWYIQVTQILFLIQTSHDGVDYLLHDCVGMNSAFEGGQSSASSTQTNLTLELPSASQYVASGEPVRESKREWVIKASPNIGQVIVVVILSRDFDELRKEGLTKHVIVGIVVIHVSL